MTLPILHAATGCDSTSFFASHGKSIALKAFYDDLDNTLEIRQLLGNDPSLLSAGTVPTFIKYLSYLYTEKEEY